MKKKYDVYHCFEVDGGYGDTVDVDDLIVSFDDRKLAEEYVEKNSFEHFYDVPYAALVRSRLEIRETDVCSSIDEAPKFDPFGPFDCARRSGGAEHLEKRLKEKRVRYDSVVRDGVARFVPKRKRSDS